MMVQVVTARISFTDTYAVLFLLDLYVMFVMTFE